MSHKNISIIWDFDKTLTTLDSTTELIKVFLQEKKDIKNFWQNIQEISGTKSKKPVDSISTSDAPVWMYMLSEIAKDEKGAIIPMDKENLLKLISHKIKLYPDVLDFLKKMKKLSKKELYKKNKIKIHHFIITAGLSDLVSAVFSYLKSSELITAIFGCRYSYIEGQSFDKSLITRNIPIYCMDKTTKTRALFEICKGCFLEDAQYTVDDLLSTDEEWCPFENMIYIGDGDTDIPAFSLIKSRKGMAIGVFDPSTSSEEIDTKSKNIRKGKRIDLFTPANFNDHGELYNFIEMRCKNIAKRYEAQIV